MSSFVSNEDTIPKAELLEDADEIIYRSTRDSSDRLDSTTPIPFRIKIHNPKVIEAIRKAKQQKKKHDKNGLADWQLTSEACKKYIWVEIVYFNGEIPKTYVEDGEIPTTSPAPAAETDMFLEDDQVVLIKLKRQSLMISSAHGNRPFRIAFVISLDGLCTTLMTRMFRVQEKKTKPKNADKKRNKTGPSGEAVKPCPRRNHFWQTISEAYEFAKRKVKPALLKERIAETVDTCNRVRLEGQFSLSSSSSSSGTRDATTSGSSNYSTKRSREHLYPHGRGKYPRTEIPLSDNDMVYPGSSFEQNGFSFSAPPSRYPSENHDQLSVLPWYVPNAGPSRISSAGAMVDIPQVGANLIPSTSLPPQCSFRSGSNSSQKISLSSLFSTQNSEEYEQEE